MLSQEEIDQQVQLLETNRQTLAVYLRQEATIGRAFSPPALVTGIQEARRNIRRIKAELRANGVSVHEDPSDEELAPTVVLKLPGQPRARLPILALALGVVLLIAGVAAIPFWRFQLANVPGALLWAWFMPKAGELGGDVGLYLWKALTGA